MSSQYRSRGRSCPPLTIYSSRVRRSQPRNVWGPLFLLVLLFILPALFVPGGAEESVRAIRDVASATLAPTAGSDAIAAPMPTVAAPPMVEMMGPPAPTMAQLGPPAPAPAPSPEPIVAAVEAPIVEQPVERVTRAKPASRTGPRASTTSTRKTTRRASKPVVKKQASAPAPAPVVETAKEPAPPHALSRRIL